MRRCLVGCAVFTAGLLPLAGLRLCTGLRLPRRAGLRLCTGLRLLLWAGLRLLLREGSRALTGLRLWEGVLPLAGLRLRLALPPGDRESGGEGAEGGSSREQLRWFLCV